MSNAGIRTTNINNKPTLADTVLVNRNGSTGLQTVDNLAKQLANGGPLADAINAAGGKYVAVKLKADLLANLVPTNGSEGRVYGDTSANNGVYLKSGGTGTGTWTRIGDLPEADLTDVNTAITNLQAALINVQDPALLDGIYGDAMATDTGDILIGFRRDGTVDVNDTYPLLDTEFKFAIVDSGLNVMFGVRHDDTLFPGAAGEDTDASSVLAFSTGSGVIVVKNGLRCPVTFDATKLYANVSASGNFVEYLRDDGSTVAEASVEVLAATSIDLGSFSILTHTVMLGQSLEEGTGGSPAVHTTAVRAARAVMFNAGVRTRGAADATIPVPNSNMYGLIDLLEKDTEGPGCGLGWGLTRSGALDAASAALISAHGKGGQTYAALKRGSVMWSNMLAAIRRGCVISRLNGLAYKMPAMVWIQGENDRTKTKAARKTDMIELQGDITSDGNAITGASGQVLVVLDQNSNWSAYGDVALSQVPIAALELAIEQPTKFVCANPKYFLPHNGDGIHLPATSYARDGCYKARALARALNGQDALPLYCTGYNRSGAVITLHMHVPTAPLVIDTSAVSNPGNYGITWNQSGGSARTISSVAVSGSDIVVTLSGDPGAITSDSWLGIAFYDGAGALGGPTTGVRSNFRDSSTTVDIDGNAMPNWACHQQIGVI